MTSSFLRLGLLGVLAGGAGLIGHSAPAPVILNEYNAVSSARYLAADSESGATNRDVYFGRVPGNGGNWFELVITADHTDLRGWEVAWGFVKDAANFGSGGLKVLDSPALADLRAGVILTVIAGTEAQGGRDTDLALDPDAGDWWINLCAQDSTVLQTDGSITSGGVAQPLPPGQFRVNNDGWFLTLRDPLGTPVFGPCGEGSFEWQGPGVNGNEVAQLRAEPSPLIAPGSAYSDGVISTFGAPNAWDEYRTVQDFAPLRGAVTRSFAILGLEPLPSAAGWRVTWAGAAGLTYLLQHRAGDDLGNPSQPAWHDLAFVRFDDAIGRADDTSAAGAPTRFYRVIEPPVAPTNAVISLSPPSGNYTGPVALRFSPPVPGAEVHYTVDGREPVLADPVAPEVLDVTLPTTVRAAVFVPGHLPGPISSAVYLGDSPTLPEVAMVLPPADLFDPGTGIYANWEQEGPAWERRGSLVIASNGIIPAIDSVIGVEITGGASRENPKKSLLGKWRSRYGASGLDLPLFSMRPGAVGYAEAVLRAGGTDSQVGHWSLLRDPVMHGLYAQVSRGFSAFEFVRLHLIDEYWGLYTLRERIDADYLVRNFGVSNPDLIKLEEEQPHALVGNLTAWQALTQFFATNVFSAAEGLAAAETLIDLDDFTDYQLFEIYAGNTDWPHNNLYAWRDRSPQGRWRYILWDTDLSFNLPWWSAPDGSPFDQAQHDTLAWATRDVPRLDLAPSWLASPDSREAAGALLWSTVPLRRLLENPEYRVRFVARCADLLNATLSATNVIHQIDQLAARIATEIPREVSRWPKEEAHPGQWEGNVESMRQFASARPDAVRAHLVSRFGLPGMSQLTIHTAGGTGQVRVGTLPAADLPWTGTYFQGVPVRLEAVASPGYRFERWLPSQSTEPVIDWVPDQAVVSITARFAPN